MFDIVLSTDKNNIHGLFAVINSIIINTKYINDIRFNILTYDSALETNNILEKILKIMD